MVNYIWKRLSKEDVDRIVKQYNLSSVEHQIIDLRRRGKNLAFIGDTVGYDERHIRRLSAKILDKIKIEL